MAFDIKVTVWVQPWIINSLYILLVHFIILFIVHLFEVSSSIKVCVKGL